MRGSQKMLLLTFFPPRSLRLFPGSGVFVRWLLLRS